MHWVVKYVLRHLNIDSEVPVQNDAASLAVVESPSDHNAAAAAAAADDMELDSCLPGGTHREEFLCIVMMVASGSVTGTDD